MIQTSMTPEEYAAECERLEGDAEPEAPRPRRRQCPVRDGEPCLGPACAWAAFAGRGAWVCGILPDRQRASAAYESF